MVDYQEKKWFWSIGTQGSKLGVTINSGDFHDVPESLGECEMIEFIGYEISPKLLNTINPTDTMIKVCKSIAAAKSELE